MIRMLLSLILCLVCCAGFSQIPNATNNDGAGYGLDKKSNVALRAITIPLKDSIKTTNENSANYVLPANAVVIDAYVNVRSSATTATLNFGTLSTDSGGDADGFLSAVNLSNTGTKRTTLGALLTSTGRYINGGNPRKLSWTFTNNTTNKIDAFITLIIYEVK